ncbi:MAG: threonylcarbamoyladenosine tRNA methylthiotransferase MtaB, partial [bacterium]
QSDAKCRQAIRSIQKKNPTATIAVVGCFSQMASEQIKDIGGVDLILGTQEKLNLHKYLPLLEDAEDTLIYTGPIEKTTFTIDTIGQTTNTTRANLKIQDGCNFICSFCIIPFARGRARSRKLDNIQEEALKLAEMGYQEVILTGVNIGTYQDGDHSFFDLLAMLNAIDGIERIRISSIEPTTVSENLFELMADPNHKVVPYLHLPLQSGSTEILKAMRRRYSLEEYRSFVKEAVERVPNIGIGTDVIVGFPGESDELFEETFENLSSLPIDYFHVFSYSERKGTRSEKLPDKNRGDIISRRSNVLRSLSDQKKGAFIQRFIGHEIDVLFESQDGFGNWQGYTENYLRVSIPSKDALKNKILKIRLLENHQTYALGTPVED